MYYYNDFPPKPQINHKLCFSTKTVKSCFPAKTVKSCFPVKTVKSCFSAKL